MQQLRMQTAMLGSLLLAPIVLFALAAPARAAIVFSDGFNGSAVNEVVWRLPTGDGTFFGRTQIKPPEYGGEDLRPAVTAGSITLQLDTFNASAATSGDSFWGHEIQTRQSFSVGSGLSIRSRIRYLGSPHSGLVGGFFTFGLKVSVRDEIDFELLSNDIGDEKLFTNVFDDDDFSQRGDYWHLSVPGLDLTAWNEYEIRWFPGRVQWFVNGTRIREELDTIPNDQMEVRLNFWAPDANFPEAYDPKLQPASSRATNQKYELQIDFVEVATLEPDLVVDAVGVSDPELNPGQSFSISATVKNQGSAPSSSTMLRYYRSTDPAISTSDTPLGTGAVPKLSAGALSSESLPTTAPSASGTYWVGACVDGVSGESITINNCSSGVQIDVTNTDSAAIIMIIDMILLQDD